MKRARAIKHEFVEFIPDKLAAGTLYISIPYATATHLCLCGCGYRVVTPLTPSDWRLTFDGETVSLYPSIGNWAYACRSHYWIEQSRAIWAKRWSQERIDAARDHRRRGAQRSREEPTRRSNGTERGRDSSETSRLHRWLGRLRH